MISDNEFTDLYFKAEHARWRAQRCTAVSVDKLTALADGGDKGAQFELGTEYYVQQVPNVTNALKYLRLAAKQEDIEAQYRVAMILMENMMCLEDYEAIVKAINKDQAEVIKNYTSAAQHGHARAKKELACFQRIAFLGKCHEQPMAVWTELMQPTISSVGTGFKKRSLGAKLLRKGGVETKSQSSKTEEQLPAVDKRLKPEKRSQKNPVSIPKEKTQTQVQQRPLFLETLQKAISDLRTMDTEIKKLVSEKAQLKDSMVRSIDANTETLKKEFRGRKNKARLMHLKGMFENIKKLESLFKELELKAQVVQQMIENFLKFYEKFDNFEVKTQEEIPDKENLSVEEQNKISTLFAALNGEINDEKNEALKSACGELTDASKAIQGKNKELKECTDKLDKLNKIVEARTDAIKLDEKYKTDKDEEAVISKEIVKELGKVGLEIEAIIKRFTGDAPAVPVMQAKAGALQPVSHRFEGAQVVKVRTAVVERPTTEQPDTTSKKQERQLKHLRKKEAYQEAYEKLLRAERAERVALYQEKTASAFAAGEISVVERKQKQEEVKTHAEHSALLSMHLEHCSVLIKTLQEENQQHRPWNVEKTYALLGSLAKVSDIVRRETKDPAIATVARRFRTAIFKQYERVLNMVGNNNNLLELAGAWVKFLNQGRIGFFDTELAVVKRVNVAKFLQIYELGSTLDTHAQDESAHWRAVIHAMDVNKSVQRITAMQTHFNQVQIREARDALVHAAADDFCVGVMSSELVALVEAEKQKKPGAFQALQQLRTLMPFFSQLRKKGVCIRHPESSEEDEFLTFILALNSVDKLEGPGIAGVALHFDFNQRNTSMSMNAASTLKPGKGL